MKKYKYLAHTADVRLKIEADSTEELFIVALEGMNNLIKENECKKPFEEKETLTIKDKIEISSIDQSTLLIDFLSEVLTHCQVNKAIYCKVKFEKLTDNFLQATIFGKNVENFDEDIKAVTYHEAHIVKNQKGNLETIVIFDI